MKLRTLALIASSVGLALFAVGLVADTQRPDPVVYPQANVDTSIVVFQPDLLAMSPGGRVAVNGSGPLLAYTARPVDMTAWLSSQSVTHVTGLPDWDTLTTRKADRVDAAPVSPSPSPSGSASPSPSASPSATPAATAAASEDSDAAPALIDLGATDHWRDSWRGENRISIAIADIPVGMPLVVVSATGEPLDEASMRFEREVNDGWITGLIWWGAGLLAVSLLVLAYVLVDLRPVNERVETWLAHRRRIGSGDDGPRPGSRRARRAGGVTVVNTAADGPQTDDAHPTGEDDK